MKRRKIRRNMSEKRLLKLKRQLRKRAKKLRLGKKRTGAYVFGTLRRVRGNPRETIYLTQIGRNLYVGRFNSPGGMPAYNSIPKTLGFWKKTGHKLELSRHAYMARRVRGNGVMADAENEFLMKYGLTPDQARSKFFSMIGTSFEKARKLSFEEQREIKNKYEEFKKKLLKAKMPNRRRGLRKNPGVRYRVGGGYRTYTLEEAKKVADDIFRTRGVIVSIEEHRPIPQVEPDWKYGIYTGRGVAIKRNPLSYHVGGLSSLGAVRERKRQERMAKRNAEPIPGKFYTVWFSGPKGNTNKLVYTGQKLRATPMSDISRAFPAWEAPKMKKFHVAGPYDTYEQAFLH